MLCRVPFFFPSNTFVQKAIARYHNEEVLDARVPYRDALGRSRDSRARKLLQPQFWKDVQDGVRSGLPLHSRHMRPHCLSIPMGTYQLNTDLIIFFVING